MTLLATDGYEYADLTQRLLGRPLENTRNDNIRCYRKNSTQGEAFARAYIKGFDEICPEGDPGPSRKFSEAHCSGLSAAFKRPIANPFSQP